MIWMSVSSKQKRNKSYGIKAIPKCWIDAVQRWDGGMIALKGVRLMKLLK